METNNEPVRQSALPGKAAIGMRDASARQSSRSPKACSGRAISRNSQEARRMTRVAMMHTSQGGENRKITTKRATRAKPVMILCWNMDAFPKPVFSKVSGRSCF